MKKKLNKDEFFLQMERRFPFLKEPLTSKDVGDLLRGEFKLKPASRSFVQDVISTIVQEPMYSYGDESGVASVKIDLQSAETNRSMLRSSDGDVQRYDFATHARERLRFRMTSSRPCFIYVLGVNSEDVSLIEGACNRSKASKVRADLINVNVFDYSFDTPGDLQWLVFAFVDSIWEMDPSLSEDLSETEVRDWLLNRMPTEVLSVSVL